MSDATFIPYPKSDPRYTPPTKRQTRDRVKNAPRLSGFVPPEVRERFGDTVRAALQFTDAQDVKDMYDYTGAAVQSALEGAPKKVAYNALMATGAGAATMMPVLNHRGIKAGTDAALDMAKRSMSPDYVGMPGERGGVKMSNNLPMDSASVEKRAREMGFDWDSSLYHATNKDFTEFDTSGRGKTAGSGAFFSDAPMIAETYHGGEMDTPRVIPAVIRPGKQLVVDAGGKNWSDIEYEDAIVNYPDGTQDQAFDVLGLDPREVTSTDVIAQAARDAGYDSVRIQGVVDRGGNQHSYRLKDTLEQMFGYEFSKTTPGSEAEWNVLKTVTPDHHAAAQEALDKMYAQESDIVSVFDPKNIRSRFAKFDPSKKDSADLLAGLAAAGIFTPPALQMMGQDD